MRTARYIPTARRRGYRLGIQHAGRIPHQLGIWSTTSPATLKAEQPIQLARRFNTENGGIEYMGRRDIQQPCTPFERHNHGPGYSEDLKYARLMGSHPGCWTERTQLHNTNGPQDLIHQWTRRRYIPGPGLHSTKVLGPNTGKWDGLQDGTLERHEDEQHVSGESKQLLGYPDT